MTRGQRSASTSRTLSPSAPSKSSGFQEREGRRQWLTIIGLQYDTRAYAKNYKPEASSGPSKRLAQISQLRHSLLI